MLAIAAALTFCPKEEPIQKKNEIIPEIRKELQKPKIRKPKTRSLEVITTQDKAMMRKVIDKEYPKMMELARKAGYTQKPIKIESKILSRETKIELTTDMLAKQKIEQVRKTIDHANKYFKGIIKKQQITFAKPKNKKEVLYAKHPKGDNRILFYPIKNHKEEIKLKVDLIYSKDTLALALEYTNENKRGETERVYSATLKENYEWDVKPRERRPISWVIGKNDIAVMETPVLEILHEVLASYTRKNITQDLKGVTEIEKVNQIVQDNINNEEFIVHGLGRNWFKQYCKDNKLGYTIEHLDTTMGHIETKEFSYKLKKIPVWQAIQLYKENNKTLFYGVE